MQGNPDSGKSLLTESEILEVGIQNPINDWNRESKFH